MRTQEVVVKSDESKLQIACITIDVKGVLENQKQTSNFG